MARHSHWHNIQLTKGKADAKKAQVFSKFAKAITLAVKEGGADAAFNSKLRAAMDTAKTAGMSKDAIDRAVQRGAGGGAGADLKEVVYEAFGPGGVALVIVCVTDNATRTVAEIKHILTRRGVSLGTSGSVMWMFEKKRTQSGIGYLPKNPVAIPDSAVREALDELLAALDENEDVDAVYTNEK
jgi:YebC/PmpR family DNA-binding regulatory protein